MKFNKIVDLKIIEFIRSHTELHDTENQNYRNYQLRNKLWTTLSKQMNLSGKLTKYILYFLFEENVSKSRNYLMHDHTTGINDHFLLFFYLVLIDILILTRQY